MWRIYKLENRISEIGTVSISIEVLQKLFLYFTLLIFSGIFILLTQFPMKYESKVNCHGLLITIFDCIKPSQNQFWSTDYTVYFSNTLIEANYLLNVYLNLTDCYMGHQTVYKVRH